MQSIIEKSSNGFLGIADRALVYPSQSGPIFINISDTQIDSMVKANKLLVDILSEEGLVPVAKADSIKTVINERAVVFKYDVISGIIQIK